MGDPEESGHHAEEIAFDYLKATDFRVVWADGVMGGLTPTGLVHFALFSERPAIAQRQVFRLERGDGQMASLGDEILEKRVSKNSIVREMACDVMMSEQAAENLARWLLDRIDELRGLREASNG